MMIQVPCLLLFISVLLATRTSAESTPSPTPTLPPRVGGGGPPCHHHPPGKGPPLPALNPQFEMRIEATIKQKGYTMDMLMHYDYPGNRGAVVMTKGGVVSQWVYNFEDYEGYFIQGGTCQTLNLLNLKSFQPINVTETTKGGHICGVHDLFSFGTKYNETFVPTNETVRGMPVNRWTSCVEQHGDIFRLDYYFTKENYSTPVGRRQVPVRARLTGTAKNAEQSTKNTHFSHVYDFISYRPGPSKDDTVFIVPQGVVCKHSTAKRDRPYLADRFTMGIEVVQPLRHQVSFSRQYFDYNANLTRIDLTPSRRAMSRYGEKYGYRPLRIIHDYSTGVQYVIDATEENCSTETIPKDSVDAAAVATDPTHVHMRHGANMFGLRKQDLEYQGQRTIRDVPCEVWSASSMQWEGVNTTIEAYWAPASWIVRSEDDDSIPGRKILYRIWVHSSDSKGYSNDYISQVYDYMDDKPDAAVFDVGLCFPAVDQQRRVIFQIPGTMESVVGGQPHHTQVAVRQAVARAAKVSPIRVNNIFFDKTSGEDIDVWLTIYENPGFRGNVEQPVPQATLDGAFNNLKRVIDSVAGLTIKVISKKRSKTLKVKRGSLKTDGDVDYPWRPYATCNIRSGYTPGSMAGLGIMMLILGVIMGVVSAFFLWKRGTGIPYQVQD